MNDFDESLSREKRSRQIKNFRDLLGIILMSGMAVFFWFYEKDPIPRKPFLVITIIYIAGAGFFLGRRFVKYISLSDRLKFEDGDIIKFNPKYGGEKFRIPIESVEKVYQSIEEYPEIIYVVYRENGDKMAQKFIKSNIYDEEEFLESLKEKDLLIEESISYRDLKEEISEE